MSRGTLLRILGVAILGTVVTWGFVTNAWGWKVLAPVALMAGCIGLRLLMAGEP